MAKYIWMKKVFCCTDLRVQTFKTQFHISKHEQEQLQKSRSLLHSESKSELIQAELRIDTVRALCLVARRFHLWHIWWNTLMSGCSVLSGMHLLLDCKMRSHNLNLYMKNSLRMTGGKIDKISDIQEDATVYVCSYFIDQHCICISSIFKTFLHLQVQLCKHFHLSIWF